MTTSRPNGRNGKGRGTFGVPLPEPGARVARSSSWTTRAEHGRVRYGLRGLTALHLLDGEDHILVSLELGEFLARCCPERLELALADVMDVPTGKHLLAYVEMRPREQMTREEILRIRPQDARVWRYKASGSPPFISKPVMRGIQAERILGLHLWPGLRSFFY
jgi:hypothetical protein